MKFIAFLNDKDTMFRQKVGPTSELMGRPYLEPLGRFITSPWEKRFDELARFNADKDKSKYSDDYLTKMAFMQKEYNRKQVAWANANGYIVVWT